MSFLIDSRTGVAKARKLFGESIAVDYAARAHSSANGNRNERATNNG
jgi:hypothetical protein